MSYVDQITADLQKRYPESADQALWNQSDTNMLPSDWLIATPTDVWGKTYSDFKQPERGNYPDFNLKQCSPVTSPDCAGSELCAAIQATVRKVREQPVNLQEGSAYQIYEQMYATMVSAKTLLDITTLTPPTGRFLATLRNAVTYLSTKPENERPVIRILYARPLSVELSKQNIRDQLLKPPESLLKDLVRDVDASAAMNIYVVRCAAGFFSWNHSKIVAADDFQAVVGGHNMWSDNYLDQKPAFDVSMKLQGPAVLTAHYFADRLWRDLESLRIVYDSWASYTYNAEKGANQFGKSAPSRDLADQLLGNQPLPAPGTAKVLAIGRRSTTVGEALWPPSWWLPWYTDYSSFTASSGQPADAAIVKMLELAQTRIRMSLQTLESLIFSQAAEDYLHADLVRERAILYTLAKAMARGVVVTIVLSSPGSKAGEKLEDYSGPQPAEVNAAMLRMLTQRMGHKELEAKRLISEKFKVASIRYSDDNSYPGDIPISSHAKTWIVDDQVFYIGSQNLYPTWPGNLNEFGFIVEDSDAAKSYVKNYWDPLWKHSSRTVSNDYTKDVEVRTDAMEFVLALRKNSRLYETWAATVASRSKGAPPDTAPKEQQEAYKFETAAILDSIIHNAGFRTSSTLVNAVLQLPFFKDQQSAVPNADSDRFVHDIATSKTLMVQFINIVNQSDESPQEVDKQLTTFLKSKGYACTGAQVNASYYQLRRHSMSFWIGYYRFWIGYYRDGWILEDGDESLNTSNPQQPANARQELQSAASNGKQLPTTFVTSDMPTLTIYGNTDVALGRDIIINPKFENGTLSWELGEGLETNATAGVIAFNEVTRPTAQAPFFTGLECYGTITFPNDGKPPLQGTVSFYARRSHEAPPDTPPSVDKEKTSNTALYVGLILAGAALAAIAAVGTFLKLRSMRSRGYERVPDEDVELEEIDWEMKLYDKYKARMKKDDDFRPLEDTEASRLSRLQQQSESGEIPREQEIRLRKNAKKAIDEQNERAKEEYEETESATEDNMPEGEGVEVEW